MKDLYDIWVLSETREFSGKVLSDAVRATFDRRGSSISSEVPAGLTSEFYLDPRITVRWRAWLRKTPVTPAPTDLEAMGARICAFLLPIWMNAGVKKPEPGRLWKPGNGWTEG